ncbi:MAG TPA: septal ring lytic transglycosylase RlpA family protein [Nitrospira sp.]|nr:septal ring lytic transglycosylase RlpA family protein [Nitrospira sp.]
MTNHTSHIRQAILWTVTLTGMLFGACSWVPKGDAQFDVGIKDRGVASWYGEQFHGKQAANGEIFNMEALTAAHRTMPLGSVVRVVNLSNGRHIHVRITDRGPYVNGRILDLSHAAAVQLGMEHGGLAYVHVEIVGQRHPELVQLSEDSRRPLLPIDVTRVPVRPDSSLAPFLRVLPSDLLLTRRVRRIPGMLAADHTAHAQIATLELS